MGKPGRKRVPTEILRLRGTHRADRRPKREPRPKSKGRPGMPAFLRATKGEAEWRRLVPLLKKAGLLELLDRGPLAVGCMQWGFICETLEKLRAPSGPVLISKSGVPMFNPYWVVLKQAIKEYMAACREFGMTPSSRAGIDLGETAADPGDDDFFDVDAGA